MGNANGIITAPVSMADVQTVLGDASNDLSALCKSEQVNKFSRFKPVVFTYTGNPIDVANWHRGTTGLAGFNIPLYYSVLSLINILDDKPNGIDWDYIKPYGGMDAPYYLEHFKGYNHAATKLFLRWNGSDSAMNTNLGKVSADLITRGEVEGMINFSDIYGSIVKLPNWRFAIAVRKEGSIQAADILWKTSAETMSDISSVVDLKTAGLAVGTYRMYPFMCNGGEWDNYSGKVVDENTPTVFIPIPGMTYSTFVVKTIGGTVTIELYNVVVLNSTSVRIAARFMNTLSETITITGARFVLRADVGEADLATYNIPQFTVASGDTVNKTYNFTGLAPGTTYRVFFYYSGTYGNITDYRGVVTPTDGGAIN